jgi:predicted transposase/invertase (TIGR01784 family)
MNRKNAPLARLDPLNDYLFYKVFGEKGDEVQLLGLLNAVLERNGDDCFTEIEIHENKTFTPEMIGDKAVTLDVRATLQEKTRVNVEAQIRNQYNMDKRSLFYWGREFVKTIKSGDDYQEIPDVMAVNIVGFNFPHAKNFHTCFHLREDREPDIILTKSLEIHYLNMVQYYRTLGSRLRRGKILLSNPLCDDPLIPWLVWFSKHSPPELLAEVKNMNAAIQAADERLVYLSGDEDAIRAYEVRFKAACDRTSMRNGAIREGLAKGEARGEARGMKKGEARGRTESTLEIARKMKEMGDSAERIHTITGLSPEAIQKL